MISHHIPTAVCPTCGESADGATCIDLDNEEGPQPGDVAICIECQTVNIYTDEYSLRVPTEEELNNLPMDEINRAREALKEFHETHPKYRRLH